MFLIFVSNDSKWLSFIKCELAILSHYVFSYLLQMPSLLQNMGVVPVHLTNESTASPLGPIH
jgi:hypothetical protein